MAEDWTAENLSFYNDMFADGFVVTVRTPGSPGVFNSDTLVYVGATDPVDQTTYGIRANYRTGVIDGTIIQQSDSKLIIPAYGLTSEITTDSQLLIDSVVQNIISVKKFNPGNVTIGYEIQVRS
jgi:hypothetical protein